MPDHREQRDEDKGPSERGWFGRTLSKEKRFGLIPTVQDEPEQLYRIGDSSLAKDQIGNTRVQIEEALQRGDTEAKKQMRRLESTLEDGYFYYGPQYVPLKPDSDTYERARKALKVRKGDIIEVSPTAPGRIQDNNPTGYEGVWVSVKSSAGKGQRFFLSDVFQDRALYGNLLSLCYGAIEEDKIKLLPHEQPLYEQWRERFLASIKRMVERDGQEEDGQYVKMRASTIEERVLGDGFGEDAEVVIAEMRRLRFELLPGKIIRIEDDR